MSDTTIELDQIEEEMLAYQVSDETLETAAGAGNETVGHYTHFFYYCTGMQACPGP